MGRLLACLLALGFADGAGVEPILDSEMGTGAGRRPHILFLMVDQMDGRLLDDATPQFKPPLPNLRALAADGVYFPQAYSSSPQCVPARSSMLAGRYPSQIKVWDNWVGIASVNGSLDNIDSHCAKTFSEETCRRFAIEQKVNGTFIDALAASGYNVTLWGKMHAGAGLHHYSGRIDAWPWGGKRLPKAAMEWTRALGLTPDQEVPGLPTEDDLQRPATGPLDYAASRSCTELLDSGLFKSSTHQFLYCSLLVPHSPFWTNATYLAQVPDLGNYSLPQWPPKLEVHPADEYTSRTKKLWRLDETSPEKVAHLRKVYFSMCIEADQLLGSIIDAFRRSSSFDDAYVIMLGDHGEHATENRMLGKNSFFEAAARVPLMMAGPGISKGQVIQDLTSLYDIFPTVLDMAGVEPSIQPVGESLLPVAKEHQKKKKKDFVVAEYHSVFSATGSFMIRQGHFKLIAYAPLMPGAAAWPPQLFDLHADPWEKHNIAPNSPSDVQRLMELLDQELDMKAADAAKKMFDKEMFLHFWYHATGSAQHCFNAMRRVYASFSAADAQKLAQWLGKPCPVTEILV